MRRVATTLVAIAAVWVLYFARANAWFRLYPAIVVFVFLALFAMFNRRLRKSEGKL